METPCFAQAVEEILQRDARYDREAYLFVRDALDHTVKHRGKARGEIREHVSGQELLGGLRIYALQQFGPMVPTVFEHWGIHATYDVGCIVFNLIGAGIFGKTDRDTLEDFRNVFCFQEAFVDPFRVGTRPTSGPLGASRGACSDAASAASAAPQTA